MSALYDGLGKRVFQLSRDWAGATAATAAMAAMAAPEEDVTPLVEDPAPAPSFIGLPAESEPVPDASSASGSLSPTELSDEQTMAWYGKEQEATLPLAEDSVPTEAPTPTEQPDETSLFWYGFWQGMLQLTSATNQSLAGHMNIWYETTSAPTIWQREAIGYNGDSLGGGSRSHS